MREAALNSKKGKVRNYWQWAYIHEPFIRTHLLDILKNKKREEGQVDFIPKEYLKVKTKESFTELLFGAYERFAQTSFPGVSVYVPSLALDRAVILPSTIFSNNPILKNGLFRIQSGKGFLTIDGIFNKDKFSKTQSRGESLSLTFSHFYRTLNSLFEKFEDILGEKETKLSAEIIKETVSLPLKRGDFKEKIIKIRLKISGPLEELEAQLKALKKESLVLSSPEEMAQAFAFLKKNYPDITEPVIEDLGGDAEKYECYLQ